MNDETPEEAAARKRGRPTHEHLYDASEQLLALAAGHHERARNFSDKLTLAPKDRALLRSYRAAKAMGDAVAAESKKLGALARRYESDA